MGSYLIFMLAVRNCWEENLNNQKYANSVISGILYRRKLLRKVRACSSIIHLLQITQYVTGLLALRFHVKMLALRLQVNMLALRLHVYMLTLRHHVKMLALRLRVNMLALRLHVKMLALRLHVKMLALGIHESILGQPLTIVMDSNRPERDNSSEIYAVT